MYDNFQQPPAYESPTTDIYAQPIYSNEYEQAPYMNNSYIYQQPSPMYQTVPQPPPIYQTAPQPPPPLQTYQPALQQPLPVNQTFSQQPPPYATAVQSPPNSAPMMQQPTNNSRNTSTNNSRPKGTPLSKGYKWPRKSIPLVCPQCGASVTTRVETSITFITILGAVLLCIFTCILVCLPFLVPACKRSTHYCPHCNSVLGARNPLR